MENELTQTNMLDILATIDADISKITQSMQAERDVILATVADALNQIDGRYAQ